MSTISSNNRIPSSHPLPPLHPPIGTVTTTTYPTQPIYLFCHPLPRVLTFGPNLEWSKVSFTSQTSPIPSFCDSLSSSLIGSPHSPRPILLTHSAHTSTPPEITAVSISQQTKHELFTEDARDKLGNPIRICPTSEVTAIVAGRKGGRRADLRIRGGDGGELWDCGLEWFDYEPGGEKGLGGSSTVHSFYDPRSGWVSWSPSETIKGGGFTSTRVYWCLKSGGVEVEEIGGEEGWKVGGRAVCGINEGKFEGGLVVRNKNSVSIYDARGRTVEHFSNLSNPHSSNVTNLAVKYTPDSSGMNLIEHDSSFIRVYPSSTLPPSTHQSSYAGDWLLKGINGASTVKRGMMEGEKNLRMLEKGAEGEIFEIDQSLHGRDAQEGAGEKQGGGGGGVQEGSGGVVEEEIIVTPKPSSSQSHIPCPRLCGFTFWGGGNGSAPKSGYGKEVGSGVVFNNGKVGDVWKWWIKKNGGGGKYPKTLRELNNAMSSYRTLQWSTPNQEDDDDESSDEDSEGEGEGEGGKEGEGRVWIASEADKEMEGWGGWGLKMGPIEDRAPAPRISPSSLSSLCLSNASIYQSKGKLSKARCMRLLSTLVGGGVSGTLERGGAGALGSKAVGRVLALHPNDPQFITIAYSILRHTQLLPAGKDEEGRYKRMGRIYGDMLGRWGELEEMTICGKHVEKTTLMKEDKIWSNPFALLCGLCGKPGDGGEFCTPCKSFKLKCGVCEGRVRGSYVMCFSCGHGFCLEHAKEWFRENEQCPTGCGCECRKETFGKVGEGGEGDGVGVDVRGIGRRGIYDARAMSTSFDKLSSHGGGSVGSDDMEL